MGTYAGSDPDYMQNYDSARLYKGMGIDEALKDDKQKMDPGTKEALIAGVKTAGSTMGAGGTIGQTLTGAGTSILAGGLLSEGGLTAAAGATGGTGLAAGLALSLYEQSRQNEAAHDRALVDEANNRKVAVQNAIAGQMSAARMLGIS